MKTLKNVLKKDRGIKVELLVEPNVIIETLERLGITDNKLKIIYPSCYLFKDKDSYKILHFKELMSLDGCKVDISGSDYQRRDSIIQLLAKWKLVKIIDEVMKETVFINVVKYNEVKQWKITHKYKKVIRQIYTE